MFFRSLLESPFPAVIRGSRRLPLSGNSTVNTAPLGSRLAAVSLPAVLFEDAPADGQPQACAPFFAGHEWLKDSLHDGFRNPGSIVAERDAAN